MKFRGYLFGIISATCYGLIPLFILPVKAVHFPLDILLFSRFLLAALIILSYLLLRREALRVNTKELLVLMLLGLLYAVSTDCLFFAYDLLTPGIASTILFVFPVFVALIMNICYKQAISKATMASLIIVLAGVFALGAQQSIFHINFVGLMVALLSALLYALYMVVVNQSGIKVSGMKLSFFSLFFSCIYFLVKSMAAGYPPVWPGTGVFVNLLWLSLVCTVLTITTLVYAIKYIGSTSASILGALEPIVAVGISVLFFGEAMTTSLVLGIVLILAGVMINIVFGQPKLGEEERPLIPSTD